MDSRQPAQDDQEDAWEFVDLSGEGRVPPAPSRPAEQPSVKSSNDVSKAFDPGWVPPAPTQEPLIPEGLSPMDQAAAEIARDLGLPLASAKTFVQAHFQKLGEARFWDLFHANFGIHGGDLKKIGKAMVQAYFTPEDRLPPPSDRPRGDARRVQLAKGFGDVIKAYLRGDVDAAGMKDLIAAKCEQLGVAHPEGRR